MQMQLLRHYCIIAYLTNLTFVSLLIFFIQGMKRFACCLLFLFLGCFAMGQRVLYSEPDKNDYRQTEFEIIGKVGGNLLIYKSIRNSYAMSVYDFDMKQKDR